MRESRTRRSDRSPRDAPGPRRCGSETRSLGRDQPQWIDVTPAVGGAARTKTDRVVTRVPDGHPSTHTRARADHDVRQPQMRRDQQSTANRDDIALHRRARVAHNAGARGPHGRARRGSELDSPARTTFERRAAAIVERLDELAPDRRSSCGLGISSESAGDHDRGEEDVEPAHRSRVARQACDQADLRSVVTPIS